jgi:hypothetical protein
MNGTQADRDALAAHERAVVEVAQAVIERFDPETHEEEEVLADWRAEREKTLRIAVEEKDVLVRVMCSEVIEAIVKRNVTLLTVHAARKKLEHQLHLARRRLELANEEIMLALMEHEHLNIDDSFEIDAHRLLVRKKSDASEQIQMAVSVSRWLAQDATDAELHSASVKDFEGLHAVQDAAKLGLDHFITDMAEFLVEHGNRARELVVTLLDDENAAEKMIEEELPKPVLFLSQIILKLRAMDS